MKRNLYPVALSLVLAIAAGAVAAGASRLAEQRGGPSLSMRGGVDGLPPLTAVGTSFTYQGRLLDGGSPASGFYDFTYKLFDTSGGSNQVGTTITHTFRTVTNGLFTDNLDFGDRVFLGEARWL